MVDSSVEGFAIEATGVAEKLDEFIDVMRSYGESRRHPDRAPLPMSLESKKLSPASRRCRQVRAPRAMLRPL